MTDIGGCVAHLDSPQDGKRQPDCVFGVDDTNLARKFDGTRHLFPLRPVMAVRRCSNERYIATRSP